MPISLVKRDGTITKSRIKELHTFEGLGRKKSTRSNWRYVLLSGRF
jgi:GTP-binding protein